MTVEELLRAVRMLVELRPAEMPLPTSIGELMRVNDAVNEIDILLARLKNVDPVHGVAFLRSRLDQQIARVALREHHPDLVIRGHFGRVEELRDRTRSIGDTFLLADPESLPVDHPARGWVAPGELYLFSGRSWLVLGEPRLLWYSRADVISLTAQWSAPRLRAEADAREQAERRRREAELIARQTVPTAEDRIAAMEREIAQLRSSLAG